MKKELVDDKVRLLGGVGSFADVLKKREQSSSIDSAQGVDSGWNSGALDRIKNASVDKGSTDTDSPKIRGVFGGGHPSNVIAYVNIAMGSNALDFGDMLGTANEVITGCSNGYRGVLAGGYPPASNVMQYVNIANHGNAIDFGDMTQARNGLAGISGD